MPWFVTQKVQSKYKNEKQTSETNQSLRKTARFTKATIWSYTAFEFGYSARLFFCKGRHFWRIGKLFKNVSNIQPNYFVDMSP